MRQSFSLILVLLILSLAIFLRVWKLETKMIFFGDAGRDFLAAYEAIEKKVVPLLGIPSSVPRFRQGPIMVWIIMLVFSLTQHSAIAVGYLVAICSVLTILLCYRFLHSQLGTLPSILMILWMATAPLLVAHGRMPFHVSPIPLLTIWYLFSLHRVLEQKPHSVMVAAFSWAMLFQFELATAPMILGLFYVLYKVKPVKIKSFLSLLAGLITGLFPQILYDITNNFAHLGGFAIWVVYRIVSFGGYKPEHTFSLSRLLITSKHFTEYWSKMISFNQPLMVVLTLVIFFVGLVFLLQNRRHIPEKIKIVLVLFASILLAFFVHGAPSEAYFPPFFVLLPVLLFYSFSLFSKPLQNVTALFFLLLAIMNTQKIIANNFFVKPTSSSFHYSISLGEQIKVMQYIIAESGNQSYKLASTDEGAQFPSFLDNYRFVAIKLGKPESQESKNIFFLQHLTNDLEEYPNTKTVSFESVNVSQVQKE